LNPGHRVHGRRCQRPGRPEAMPALPSPRETARPRLCRAITTLLLIMLAAMIVRDIFARRFSSAAAPPPDVTQRSS
jgi:hypothetical protein